MPMSSHHAKYEGSTIRIAICAPYCTHGILCPSYKLHKLQVYRAAASQLGLIPPSYHAGLITIPMRSHHAKYEGSTIRTAIRVFYHTHSILCPSYKLLKLQVYRGAASYLK